MKKARNNWSTGLIYLFLLSLLGCNVAGEEVVLTPSVPPFETQASVTGTSTEQPLAATETATLLPVEQQLPTVIPAQSMTPSPLPSATTVTATATQSGWQQTLTPIPGQTPLPTILPELREQSYEELMATNNGCELPCWWGFVLGQSTLAEVRQFYERFSPNLVGLSDASRDLTILDITLLDVGTEFRVEHVYAAENDLLETIFANVAQDSSLQIEPLLARIGQPKEVWLWTHPEPAFEGQIRMELILYYPDIGMVIHYELSVNRVEEDVVACFDQIGTVQLSMWRPEVRNPDGDRGLEAFLGDGYRVFTVAVMHPIQEVSNWDVTQFYTTLVDPNHTDCLKTPADIWPSRF